MPVILNNVDDYLGPSQACVNPLFTAPSKSANSTEAVVLGDGSNGTVAKGGAGGDVTTAATALSTGHAVSAGQVVGRSSVRRRIRQRPVPRIIQSEDDTTPTATASQNIGGAVKLVHYDTKLDAVTDGTTKQKKKTKATVTLSDCLSCSGCVTSAEAVLMSHHSIEKLREVAGKVSPNGIHAVEMKQYKSISNNPLQPKKLIVFTISAASLADLYRHLYLETEETEGDRDVSHKPSRHELLTKLSIFLNIEFGAKMVIDGILSQQISLLESAEEFCYRYKKQQVKNISQMETDNVTDTSISSIALSSTKTRYIKRKEPKDASMNVDNDTLLEVTTLSHPPGLLVDGDEKDEQCIATVETEISSSTGTLVVTNKQSTPLPMLASSCPGFVCLVEKTAPKVVPLLSSVKSPMAVSGALLKSGVWGVHEYNNSRAIVRDTTSSVNAVSNNSIYHVAIMPCHDKKLEAGRNDFAWERQTLLQYSNSASSTASGVGNSDSIINEVDLVLTTGELLEILTKAISTATATTTSEDEVDSSLKATMIRDFLAYLQPLARDDPSQGACIFTSEEASLDLCSNTPQQKYNDLELDTGIHGSGSYADFIFRFATRKLFGCTLPSDKPLPWKGSTSFSSSLASSEQSGGVIRRRRRRQETTDLREIVLFRHADGTYSCCDGEGATSVLRFATAYGFKNVQLILQNLSKEKQTSNSMDSGYDYVEIMACPSGCPNGGGQIGSLGKRETPRETKERVRRTVSVVPVLRFNEYTKATVYEKDPFNDGCFGRTARRLLHTRFHVVPKLELSTGATAGVAVSDTNW